MNKSYKTISLPKLNNLVPTIESTTLKLMEEIGEFTELVDKFTRLNGDVQIMTSEEAIDAMSKELLDISQVAISLTFVLEDMYNIDINSNLDRHLHNLKDNGYILFDTESDYEELLSTLRENVQNPDANFKNISLPRLNNLKPTLIGTSFRLIKHAGAFAQVAGKFKALSGEQRKVDNTDIADKLCEKLLKVAQVAVSLMFIFEDKYNVDIDDVIEKHINKLRIRKYIK